MNSVKRQLLKPKKHCGEYPRQVPLPQRTDFKSTKIKRKNDDDSDHQPPNKKIQLSNQKNKSKLTGTNSIRNESDSINLSKSHELSTPKYRIPKTTSANKCSANNRLKKYRQCLGERKEEVIKVHSVFKSASPKCKSNDSTVPKSNDSTVPKSYDRINNSSKTTCNDYTCSTSSTSVQKRLLKAKSFSNIQLREMSSLKATSNNESNPSETSQFTNKTSDNDSSNLNFSVVNPPLDEDSDVEMEWSPIEVNEVVSDIQKLRQDMQINKEHDIKNKNESNENIYIVVDTNVFISHLTTIKDLINLNPYASKCPVIIVPWMVVQELDFFKDGRSESNSMRNSARRAVKFINDNLTSKNRRLRGQTVQDALKQETQSSNPDDGILFCCMQMSQENKSTVLLSNDVNLRNKVLIHGISSHGTADIVSEIKEVLLGKANKKNKGEQIISVFTRLCSHIIENEMKLAYGTVARNLISDPPWSLKQCLIYIKRFWSSVFSLIIPQKQFVKILDDMIYFHTSRKDISSEEDVEQFTKLCFSMCVYFKNCLVKYKEQIQDCITDIEEIVS